VDLQSPQSPQEKIVDFLSGPLLIGIGLALVIGGPLVGRKSDPESNGAKFSWSLFGFGICLLLISTFFFVAENKLSEDFQENILNFLSMPVLMIIGGLISLMAGIAAYITSDLESNGAKFFWSLFGFSISLFFLGMIFLEADRGIPQEKIVDFLSGRTLTIIGVILIIGGFIDASQSALLFAGGVGLGLIITKIFPPKLNGEVILGRVASPRSGQF